MPKKIVLGKGLASLIGPDVVSRAQEQEREREHGDLQIPTSLGGRVQAGGVSTPLSNGGTSGHLQNGLSGLRSYAPGDDVGGPIVIDISTIKVNRFQPRKSFDEKELEELANSIRENGLIQPLIVTRSEDGFELIAGERRLRACKIIGIRKIPVVVKRVTDKDKLAMAIIENVQRSDLNCVEEACAYYQLMEDFNLTQDEMAKKVGKERSTVANFLRILNLPSSVIELLQQEKLSFGHAKLLVGLKDGDKIERLASDVVSKGHSVRELENILKATKPAGQNIDKSKTIDSELSARIEHLRQDLEKKTGFHILINTKNSESGSIVLRYNNKDEFNTIYEVLAKR